MKFPYIPHTDDDIRDMLPRSGARSIDELFSDIPESIRLKKLLNLPAPLSELELRKELSSLSLKIRTRATALFSWERARMTIIFLRL